MTNIPSIPTKLEQPESPFPFPCREAFEISVRRWLEKNPPESLEPKNVRIMQASVMQSRFGFENLAMIHAKQNLAITPEHINDHNKLWKKENFFRLLVGEPQFKLSKLKDIHKEYSNKTDPTILIITPPTLLNEVTRFVNNKKIELKYLEFKNTQIITSRDNGIKTILNEQNWDKVYLVDRSKVTLKQFLSSSSVNIADISNLPEEEFLNYDRGQIFNILKYLDDLAPRQIKPVNYACGINEDLLEMLNGYMKRPSFNFTIGMIDDATENFMLEQIFNIWPNVTLKKLPSSTSKISRTTAEIVFIPGNPNGKLIEGTPIFVHPKVKPSSNHFYFPFIDNKCLEYGNIALQFVEMINGIIESKNL